MYRAILRYINEGNSRLLIGAVLLATSIKLLLAWFTVGSNDVVAWLSFAKTAQDCGSCVYGSSGPYGDPFNHPPFVIHFLKLLPVSGDLFPFWLRLPSIAADAGTVFLVHRLAPTLSQYALMLLALNPVSILISGFHGNTDPVMIAFLLAAIFFATKNQALFAGLAFGMAINVKVIPLLFAPCLLVYIMPNKSRAKFCVGAIVVVLLLSLPYALDTREVVKSVFGYRGLFTNWSFAHYADLAGLQPSHLLAKPSRWAIVAVSVALPFCTRRRGLSLFAACSAVTAGFYFLTPSLALQYLAWGVPFVIILGLWYAVPYYVLGGTLIGVQYHRWSGGRWIFADSHSVSPVTAETEFLSFALWVTCGAMLFSIVRQIAKVTSSAR